MAGFSFSAAWSAANRLAGFAYDAVVSKGRRKAPDGVLRSEDAELNRSERRKMISGARDLHRNFTIASWAIRKHLDYVTTFNFQGKGEHSDWLQAFVKEWSKAKNFDVAGRHPRRRYMRLLEARRLLDGDCGTLKTAIGKVQAIEGDRICTPYGGPPPGVPADQILHGVQVGDVGQALSYCVCKRGRITDWGQRGTDFTFEKLVPAEHMILHGHFDRFDQVRGISPLAGALNSLRDTYEGLDYIFMRLKLQQLFGLVLYRGDPTSITRESSEADNYETQDYSETVRLNGTKILDLDIGDRAEFLESKTPATETQAFIKAMIGIVLKGLDLPFSFYDESFSNYSGSRQALLQYEQSANNARQDVRDVLDELLLWRLQIAETRGELPPGTTAVELIQCCEWIAAGLPWIDPLKEVNADVTALEAGLTSRTRLCRERGQDFYQITDERAEEEAYLASKGLVSKPASNAELNRALLAAGAESDG